MVFYSDRVSSAEDDEYIYVAKKDKEEDTEMQMLTPIMLESMIDLHSPPNSPDIFRVLKETDKTDRPDDATEMTTESFSDILLPTFETPPRITTNALDDDDTSEVSFESYGLGENTSAPRNITSTGNVSNYPLRIPFDVLYEGEVIFATSHVAKRIHLQPRRSAQADSIFVPKAVTQDYPIYAEYALADSMTSFDDNDGAEECKDDDGVSSYEEGFAYMLGDRFKEEQYWGDYDGHYGSHDFEEDGRGSADYALDHASVQGVSTAASGPSTRYEPFAQQPSAQSFLENLHEFFTASCFSCTNDFTLQPIRNRGSNHRSHKNSGGSFEPADYGVSPRSEGHFF